ncbi:MAG: HAMP domain-containing sensor histidine kinase [Pseudomonadota bacterium]
MATSSSDPSGPARRPASLFVRLLVVSSLWCLLALSVTAIVLVGLFRDHLGREADMELRDDLVELVARTRLDREGRVQLGGGLSGARFERPFSGWAWQVRRQDTVLAQSASLGPLQPGAEAALAAPAGEVGLFEDALGQRLRGLSRAVAPRFQSERLVFAVARPQDEIDRAVSQFTWNVVIALGVLGIGLVATAVAALWIGLRPLRLLRIQIARMREGETPPAIAWPREIAPIARELDALRVHTERLVERARGLAADLAHAIKTPLSVIRQQADGLAPEDSATLRRQADRIGLSLERYLGTSGAGRTRYGWVDIATCVADLTFALAKTRAEGALRIDQRIPPGARFRGDEADLYEMLGNPLDNAGKWARSAVCVRVEAAGEDLRIIVEDDGPGIPAADREAILQRGRRLDRAMPGHGLGLAILRDLVALYGGIVRLEDSALGGLAVVIVLPNA